MNTILLAAGMERSLFKDRHLPRYPQEWPSAPIPRLLPRQSSLQHAVFSLRSNMAQNAPDETLSLLTRLSQKPGVQSTLILSRETGAIVRTSGLISNNASTDPDSTHSIDNEVTSDEYVNVRKESGIHSAEDVASMVWSFLTAAGNLVHELDKEDNVKLLRLRTKKKELVIVPDPSYILVAVHDTPPV